MASLRLPRLCCQWKDDGTEIVFGFNLQIYHALCGGSAVLALLGLAFCYYRTNRRNRETDRTGVRVLAASGLVTAGLLVNSVVWLSVPDFLTNQAYWGSHILCIVISTWIHYFCAVLFWAFFCYSLEICQLFRPNPTARFGKLYTFVCWGASSLLILHGFLMWIPSEKRCDSKQGLVLFHDVLLYIPLVLALFGSPFLLRRAMARVPRVLMMQCGVYTCSERNRKRSLCRRLLQINCTFIACWLGNLLGDFMLLFVEVWGISETPRPIQVAALTLFVITGILNPMFCGVHSLAFFGWRSSAACVNQSSTATETPPVIGQEWENSMAEEEHLLRMQSAQPSEKHSFPNILQILDSYSSMEFRCSTLEINAVRLLGTRDSASAHLRGSERRPQHSNV